MLSFSLIKLGNNIYILFYINDNGLIVDYFGWPGLSLRCPPSTGPSLTGWGRRPWGPASRRTRWSRSQPPSAAQSQPPAHKGGGSVGVTCPMQCCGSGMISSGSGYEFLKFCIRILRKLFKHIWNLSTMCICHFLLHIIVLQYYSPECTGQNLEIKF